MRLKGLRLNFRYETWLPVYSNKGGESSSRINFLLLKVNKLEIRKEGTKIFAPKQGPSHFVSWTFDEQNKL